MQCNGVVHGSTWLLNACCTKVFGRIFMMVIVSIARPGRPPFAADNKGVRITIGNGSRVKSIRGELVCLQQERQLLRDTSSR